MRAYVLVTVEPLRSREVAEACARIPGVAAADVVTGPYDVVCVVEGEAPAFVYDVILNKIQGVKHVARTMTCAVME